MYNTRYHILIYKKNHILNVSIDIEYKSNKYDADRNNIINTNQHINISLKCKSKKHCI